MRANLSILITAVLLVFTQSACSQQTKKMKLNPLTPAEQDVILHKATERPFSGEYENNRDKGTYVCKQCDAPLYRSESSLTLIAVGLVLMMK